MRKYPDASGNLILGEGDYGQKDSVWYVRPPGQHIETLLHKKVTEHEDGTVTVVPSFVVRGPDGEPVWLGFLIKGEFTEVNGGRKG